MLENAVRICDAKFGAVYRCEGDAFRFVAMHNSSPAFAELTTHLPFRPSPKHYFGPIMATKAVVHVADCAAEQGYIERRPEYVTAVELGGVRTYLIVPMLKENELIGVFIVGGQEVRLFTDKQIELVQNFAAQAVIAIENARLLNELRQSLERQTATSEVLQVISSSSGDLQPVFASILANATRICEADFGVLVLYENAAFQVAATHNAPPAFVELRQRQPTIRASGALGRVVAGKQLVDISDCLEDASYKRGDADFVRFVDLCRVRSLILAPMLKENELIGVIGVYRTEVRPFTDKQIALVQNFASQAVIAIENARLLRELRQRTTDLTERTADLTEALEQQTATSDVLQLISRSPGDLEPVFASMLENAVRICDAKFAIMNFPEPGGVRPVAMHNVPEAFAELRQRVVHFGPKHPLTHVAATKQMMHIPDLELYADEDAVIAKFRELTGARTILHVPMLKDEELVGIVSIYRQEVRVYRQAG